MTRLERRILQMVCKTVEDINDYREVHDSRPVSFSFEVAENGRHYLSTGIYDDTVTDLSVVDESGNEALDAEAILDIVRV